MCSGGTILIQRQNREYPFPDPILCALMDDLRWDDADVPWDELDEDGASEPEDEDGEDDDYDSDD